MITTRRQIVNEQDRYGGYAVKPASRINVDIDEAESIRPDDFVRYNSRMSAPSVNAQRTETFDADLRYSERPEYPGLDEYVGLPETSVKPRAKTARKRVPRESEDVMPSIKTRAYMTGKPEEIETVKHTESKEGMSSKTKVMLAAYVATVIILAAIVIATGVAISGAESGVSSLEYELASKNAVIMNQQAELSSLGNDTYLTGAAVEQGMKKVENATEVNLVDFTASAEYEARTNWFDKFCDWLSKIIGG